MRRSRVRGVRVSEGRGVGRRLLLLRLMRGGVVAMRWSKREGGNESRLGRLAGDLPFILLAISPTLY